MMRVIYSLCLVLLIHFALSAQIGPKARVEGELVADKGDIPKGATVEHTFIIKNEGDRELVIYDVRPSCGCTVTSYTKVIPPQGTGEIKAIVETKAFEGPISKSITVLTNDKSNPQITLKIKARVVPVVTVLPGWARFASVKGEPVNSSKQLLWSESYPPFKVLSIENEAPDKLKATFRKARDTEKDPTGPANQWVVEIKLLENAPEGPIATYVHVITNHPEQSKVTIPVSGIIKPLISIVPSKVDFGETSRSEHRIGSIFVINNSQKPIEVVGASTNIEGIDVEIKPLEEGKKYSLIFKLDGQKVKKSLNGELTILTTSSKIKEVRIPITGKIID